ncbi:small RNA 2'-O-methyltransferase isoform X2 [Nelusetta ayraudi]|uniref:small RNA 2'-O-methyltransferase isoform X2 n=1 Tax=Nelusetta ayraudi TaxID=303726 RepID=UPI003F7307E2
MFSPPLHRQRHQFVVDFVNKNKPQKVADLGCSECTLLMKLKFHRDIELLVGVDIDGAKLKKKWQGLGPLSTDYLQPSYYQLRIELYQGSVTQKDARLRGFDLVTSVELIEHLTLADLGQFSDVVFGYMIPAVAIISTPNAEFNTLLPGLTGFRHHDHKFEWTRAEFQSWALGVALQYGYEVEFTGVGPAPLGQQDAVGFCTQIGVFRRLRQRPSCRAVFGVDVEELFSYELLYSITYPSLRDNNTLRKFLVAEVLCFAEELKQRWMEERMAASDGSLLQTEGGAEAHQAASGQRVEARENPTACGPEDENLMGQRGLGLFMTQEEANQGAQEESPSVHRFVAVPLASLWTSPKVSALSGSLRNLRHFLMEEPTVRLSQDGSAVMLKEEDLDEGSFHAEDGDYGEANQCSQPPEQGEEWEASV